MVTGISSKLPHCSWFLFNTLWSGRLSRDTQKCSIYKLHVGHPWISRVKPIARSYVYWPCRQLVEICFPDTTMKRQEQYFWNVIKMTASLMTSCQVLSIRLRYPRTAAHERDVIWRDMYERILQKGNSWLLHLPLKWTMHFSFDRHYGEMQVREWMCDIYSEGCNCQNNRKKRQKPLN